MSSKKCTNDSAYMCVFCGRSSFRDSREKSIYTQNQVLSAIECAIEYAEDQHLVLMKIKSITEANGIKFEADKAINCFNSLRDEFNLKRCGYEYMPGTEMIFFNEFIESEYKLGKVDRINLRRTESAKLKLEKMKQQYSEFLCERTSIINEKTIFSSCNKFNCCRFRELFGKTSMVSGCYSPESELESN